MTTVDGGMELRERQIISQRVIHAPPARVFEAWTAAHHLARWFGPHGFTITTREFSFGPGGHWDFTMHGPDGTDYLNYIKWTEIEPPHRITYRQGGRPGDSATFEGSVTFEVQGTATLLTLCATFPDKAQRDHVATHFGAVEGGDQTLARLAMLVEEAS